MTGLPQGFGYSVHGDEVVIRHGGKRAATLRRDAASRFLADVAAGDPQAVMARVTGNYRRGNERMAREHPRNRGR